MKTTYTCHSYNHSPLILLLQDTPEIISIVLRILCAYCPVVLCQMNTLRINPRTCRVSTHPQLFMCFTEVFKIPFDLLKILKSLLLLKFLLTCIMVNTISLVNLLSSFFIIILSLLIQYIVNAHNPRSNDRIHPSGSDIILNMS